MRKPDHNEPQTIDMLRKLGYESSDVSLPVLVKCVAFLFAFIGGTAILTYIIYVVFVPPVPESQKTAASVAKLPPGVPALQGHPKFDMRAFRQQEEARLNGYGWVDKSNGIAHIPVDQALEAIAASGQLPKAEPGAGNIPPARGEDIAPIQAAPGGPAVNGATPDMPNGAAPGMPNTGGPPAGTPMDQPPVGR